MNDKEKMVIEMLRYYYWMKYRLNLISDETMADALNLLKKERNPFRNPNWFDQLQENAIKARYELSHTVFRVKLRND